jgi:hypothetical protein
MGPWKKFESTVVRLKRSYEDTGSVVCLTTKGRQLERNFEELKPASHVLEFFPGPHRIRDNESQLYIKPFMRKSINTHSLKQHVPLKLVVYQTIHA